MAKSAFLQVCVPFVLAQKERSEIVRTKDPTISDNYQDRGNDAAVGEPIDALTDKTVLTIPAHSECLAYGIATLADALAIQRRIKEESPEDVTVCGMADDGTFYVRPRWWGRVSPKNMFAIEAIKQESKKGIDNGNRY